MDGDTVPKGFLELLPEDKDLTMFTIQDLTLSTVRCTLPSGRCTVYEALLGEAPDHSQSIQNLTNV